VPPTGPTIQVAVPFPPGQRPLNVGAPPACVAVSDTETPEAGPFCVETCTLNDAVWPALTLVPEGCTLTHSSAWEATGAVAEGEGVKVAEDSGSHSELAAASAAVPPQAPFTKPKARTAADMKQVAAVRECADRRIRPGIFPGYRHSPS
jgi:hypothetical protein